jgi:hypothetical protein
MKLPVTQQKSSKKGVANVEKTDGSFTGGDICRSLVFG